MTSRQHHEYVDQGTLAAILGVNRSTINRYQKLGLPFKNGETGEANFYDLGLATYWYSGFEISKQKNVHLTSLECILLSRAFGGGESSFAYYKTKVLSMSDRFGASREDVATACGFLSGAGLLPWHRT